MSRGTKQIGFAITIFFVVLVGSLYAAAYVRSDAALQMLVAQFGYGGIAVIATIAGLNAIVPIPAATLTPIFIAANLEIPFIIAALVLGTVIADITGYIIGRFSRTFVQERYPKTYETVQQLTHNHRRLILPAVAVYAAVVPFPNEAVVIPLALSGVSIRSLIVPLIIGNIIHQTALVYGVANIFSILF